MQEVVLARWGDPTKVDKSILL